MSANPSPAQVQAIGLESTETGLFALVGIGWAVAASLL